MNLKKEKIPLLAALATLFICLLLYLPAVNCGFINYDDPEYVLNNPVIRHFGMDTLAQAFFQSHVGWWMPLTWISLAIDYHFWGLNPVGYHLTNTVLHAVNAGLVVLVADALCKAAAKPWASITRAGSAYGATLLLAGLLFGAHPLRVESVAWVTERKDVLNGLFAFSSILFYLHYVWRQEKAPGGEGRSGVFFALSLCCFACSLMAKSVSVVLPAMLIVLDWVPLGRLRTHSLRQLFMEKWPFWVVASLITLFTFFFAAQSQYLVTYAAFPFAERVVVSGNALWEYGRMLVLPFGLSPFNVIPDPIPVSYTLKAVLAGIVLVTTGIAGCLGKAQRLAACLLCYLLPLLPVLAFFQNGDQSHADRFTYLPSLALSIFTALFLSTSRRFSGDNSRRVAIVALSIVMVVFMGITSRQLDVWQSPETFWTRIIEVEPLAIVYKERGKYYHSVGRYDEAVADFTAALARITPTLKPYEYNFYAFRAESLRKSGKLDAAVRDFTAAITLHPQPTYYYHRGLALQAIGKPAAAEEDFRLAGPDPGPVIWID